MEELAGIYIAIDRRLALARGEDLPYHNQGAVLFADISGFTPLTAALLKELGLKRGPEELTRQLNLVYDALITEVDRFGGSVIGFAGDAITCWFEADHGLRAVTCGLAMQQAMAQFTSVVTPAGTSVSLGMKAAIAVGPVRRFIVGDPQTQLMDLLAGATLARMAEAEHHAERGEVVVAPEVVSHLGHLLKITEVRIDADTGQQFAVISGLIQPVLPRPWSAEVSLTEAQVKPWVLPPIYERLKSGQGKYLAEIRPVVALFMRFGGIDYDSDEQAGQKLDAYIQWVQGVLTRYGGFLLSITIGDKGSYLYATFGALLSHENDPARAVASALEFQSPPQELAFIGPVQIGITQGRVRVGTFGGTTRHTYGVMGDEVNMAARLMQKAQPGQILISHRIAEAVAQEYRLEYLGPLKVKGKEEPIPVSAVLGRGRQVARKPVKLFATPLVGREAELAQLEPLLAGSVSGTGQILRIEGPAGIGKSHLVAEFGERALQRFWRVVTGTCQSTSQDIPYHPWRQIFRSLFILMGDADESEAAQHIAQVAAIVEELNPAWLPRLPLLADLLRLPIPDNTITAAFDPRLRQEALFTLVIDLLQSWAKTQPLLLLIEDSHWLDEASRELTLAVGRALTLTNTELLLVVVHRPPLDPQQPVLPGLNSLPNYQTLLLDELSSTGMTALVANRLSGQPAPLLLNLIQLQARGNPFFVEELINTLREANGIIRREDGCWTLSESMIHNLRQANCLISDERGELILNPDVPLAAANLGLPDSIHGLVLARLDRLLEAHKLTLKVASVIGRIFQFQLLSRSHPVETDPEALLQQIEVIEAREFTRLETPLPDLTHIFKHNVTCDVAYETLLEAQQRQLHQAVAEALETLLPEAVELLAYHYSRAKIRDKTLYYLDKAAQKAQREYANETALHYYSQVLELEDRWEWRKGQIEVLHILGRREKERAALERWEAVLGRGAAEQRGRGDFSPASLRPRSPAAFELAYLWGQYYEAIAAYPQAQPAVERALLISRAEGDRVNEARCLSQLGLIARQPGDYERAKAWYQQALALFDYQADDHTEAVRVLIEIHNGLGTTYRQQGDFDQARHHYEEALLLSRQHKNLFGEAEALNSLGVTAYYGRNFGEALVYFQQALSIRQTIGDRTGEGKSLYSMSFTYRDKGDYEQAQKSLAAALAISQTTGNRWDETNILNDLGILYHYLGDFAAAQSYLQQGLALAKEINDEAGQAYLLANSGLVAIDADDLPLAQTLLTDGLTLAHRQDDKRLIAWFLNCSGVVSLRQGQILVAIEQTQTSLALRQSLEMHLDTADNLANLAIAFLQINDMVQALNYAQQTLTILDMCGGEGPEFPQQDYFICYQIFAVAKQANQAQTALKSAYNLVMTRAAKITDPILRQSFLERVAINREIVAAYQQVTDPSF
jgi:class 3 adenylate cyclase/tetratricopeptide (TPR) repeat protein